MKYLPHRLLYVCPFGLLEINMIVYVVQSQGTDTREFDCAAKHGKCINLVTSDLS